MASIPAAAFPRFLDLPFEIRWAVYELCLPTRVVDSAIDPGRAIPGSRGFADVQAPAYRYIVTKFSTMPVICKAIPEVYREVRRHLVAPLANEWAWTWFDPSRRPQGFTDPRPILFDPRSDVLYTSPFHWSVHDDDPQQAHKIPAWLARSQDAVVALGDYTIEGFIFWPGLVNYCFLGRKNCTIILSETRLIKPMESIISCGLFGPFGEERTVLIDVDDFERIDYFDKKLNGQDIHPRKRHPIPRRPGGVRRYSSHSTVHPQRAWDENSPVVSAEKRAEIIAKDKKDILYWVKDAWLATSGSFRGSAQTNSYFVPSEGSFYNRDRVFDEEHPNAKLCLDKLPSFTLAVRVHAMDLEECARLWGAELAWRQENPVDETEEWD